MTRQQKTGNKLPSHQFSRPTEPSTQMTEAASVGTVVAGAAPVPDAPRPKKSAAKAPDLRKGSMLMASGTFVSRFTGQIRTLLMVAAIGSIGTVADAFDIGNRLPNILFNLIAAGVLQAVLIPQILRAMKAEDAEERLNKLLTISAISIFVLTVILAALTPWVVGLMTIKGDWTAANRHLAIIFAFWCVPQMFFYGLFTLLGQVLNARGQFGAYGWAPVANNIVSIIGFGAFLFLFGRAPALGITEISDWSLAQTALLAGTATLGIAAQALLLFIPLRRSGFRWHLRFGLHGIGLRSAGKVVGWTLGAVLLENVGNFWLTNITSAAGQAAVQCQVDHGIAAAAETAAALAECPAVAGNAAYSQALTIYLLPHSLIIVSIITALFPRMSAAAAAGDIGGVRRDVSLGLRTAGVFSVFSAAVLLVLARPLTKALLPTASTEMVNVGGPVLQALALGLIALGATVMVKRMYFAFEDGRGIFIIQIFATVSMVIALWLSTQFLHYQYWAVAAAGSFALSTWISVLLRIKGMRAKLNGIDGHRVLRLYLRAGVAALLAAVAGLAVLHLMNYTVGGPLGWTRSLALSAVAGTVMTIVYLAALKVLSVQELDDAMNPILRRLRPILNRIRRA